MRARLLSERATERRSALWAESGVRRQELWTSTILPIVRNRPLLRRLLSTTITHLQDKNERESLNYSGMKKKIVLAAERETSRPKGWDSHCGGVVVTPEQAWSIAENLCTSARLLSPKRQRLSHLGMPRPEMVGHRMGEKPDQGYSVIRVGEELGVQSEASKAPLPMHPDSERIGAQGRMFRRMWPKKRQFSSRTGASTGAPNIRMNETS